MHSFTTNRKNIKLKKGVFIIKRIAVRCPYCGAMAVKRPATYIFGDKANTYEYYYVCSHFPSCNTYVAAHEKTGLPMGTLANGDLRNWRIRAHKALDKIWQNGYMTKDQAYKWLQAKLDLPESETHIAKFGEYRCKQTITLCNLAFSKMSAHT